MPAPAPYNAVAGRVSISVLARQHRGNYEWLYRWSDEMNADAVNLDLKKLAQFTYQHCRLFRAAQDALTDANAAQAAVAALAKEYAGEGMTWPDNATMISDFVAIYQACGTFFTFIDTNFPQAKSFATRTYDSTGTEIEQPTVIAKPAAIATRVSAFRALFA